MNVPKIRFPEFSGEWEEKKLGEESKIEVGGDIDKLKLVENGEFPVVSNSLINDGIIGYYKEFYRIEAPAVTVTGRGDIGHAKARNYNFTPIVRLLSIKSNHNMYFMEHIVNKHKVLIESTGVPQLTAPQLANYKVYFTSLPEQQKIGNFFKKLDESISLQKNKVDNLKTTKKSLLQKMFPKNGETVPEIRFPEFSGEWEEKKLGEVADITMGQSPSSANYTDNPNDYILVQGNTDIKNGYVFPRVWTTQVTKIAEKGNLILSVRAPVGDIGKTYYDVVLGRGVAGIKGNEFIFQTLVKLKNIGYWNKLSTGSTFESINSSDIKDTYIHIPNFQEQQKIGNFFKKLDTLILLNQQKLENLEKRKKGLLQKMFV